MSTHSPGADGPIRGTPSVFGPPPLQTIPELVAVVVFADVAISITESARGYSFSALRSPGSIRYGATLDIILAAAWLLVRCTRHNQVVVFLAGLAAPAVILSAPSPTHSPKLVIFPMRPHITRGSFARVTGVAPEPGRVILVVGERQKTLYARKNLRFSTSFRFTQAQQNLLITSVDDHGRTDGHAKRTVFTTPDRKPPNITMRATRDGVAITALDNSGFTHVQLRMRRPNGRLIHTWHATVVTNRTLWSVAVPGGRRPTVVKFCARGWDAVRHDIGPFCTWVRIRRNQELPPSTA